VVTIYSMCICHEYALVFFCSFFVFFLFLFVMLPNFSMNKVDYYKAGSRVMADCGVWQ